MAWLRIESNFASHRKVLAAGQQLGKGAVARVIGIWTIGACYAVAHLTDGLVPGLVLKDTRYDKRPGEVIDAMVAARLLHVEGDSYRLHDFHDYNPSAADVKEKRHTDQARKRQFQKLSARNPNGKLAPDHADGANFPRGNAAPDRADDATCDAIGAKFPRVPNPNPIPRSRSRKKEQCAGAHPACAKVLVKLAHVVLDRLSDDADVPPMSELCATLKDLAAVHQIPYATGREITKAMDSALAQRRRQAS
jgi:hypothetical protein